MSLDVMTPSRLFCTLAMRRYVDFKTAVQCALCLNMINVSDNPDMMMKQIDDVQS